MAHKASFHSAEMAKQEFEVRNNEFKAMLKKHLPNVLQELLKTGNIVIYDGLKESPRIRVGFKE